jgi:apolipoprotein N-acyltransferase
LKYIFENTKLRTLLFVLTGGVLLGLSFPPYKTWFLVYFGLLILLYLILSSARMRQAFLRGYFTLLVFNEVAVYWISGWHSDDTFLKIGGVATVLVHPLFFMLPVLLIYAVSRFRKEYALILFPFLWVGFEFFHNQWQFTFPWLELGNTETYNLNRIQYIEYTGVHGVSFLISTFTSILYLLSSRIFQKRWSVFSPKAVTAIAVMLVILLFPNFYSNHRLNYDNSKYFKTEDSTKIINISIAQANTDPFRKWAADGQESLIASYLRLLREGLKYDPHILILHETATPYYFLEDYNGLKTKLFTDLVDSSGKYLVMGIPHLEYYDDSTKAPRDARRMKGSGRLYDTYNSAIMLEPGKNKKLSTIHRKTKLVPFSERVPYQEYFSFLKDWFTWGVGLSGWQIGKVMTIFELKNAAMGIDSKFAVLICFESVFSELVSESVKDGAEFLVIVTNDGWWGFTSGPVQHEQYAVLRALENRKWVARCAQTGISNFIDPLGNIYNKIPYGTEGVINRSIIANTEKTFYSEYGDITGRVSFYAGVLCLVFCLGNYAYRRILKIKA